MESATRAASSRESTWRGERRSGEGYQLVEVVDEHERQPPVLFAGFLAV